MIGGEIVWEINYKQAFLGGKLKILIWKQKNDGKSHFNLEILSLQENCERQQEFIDLNHFVTK